MRWPKVADSTGVALTGSGLLTASLVLRRRLRREVLADDETYVGLLVPPSVGGVLANAAVTLDARIAVNLNYTVSSELMNQCIARCGIRHVLTSRKVLERFPLKMDAQPVYLEDLRANVTLIDKLAAAIAAWVVPVPILERLLGLTRFGPDDLMTIIFTSGSTGDPKGVMLSYHNIGSNVEAFAQVLALKRDDVLIGVLPLFHSFGYTTTLWSALMLDPKGVYHYSPLEPRTIGKLSREYKATILVSTPTFLRSYVRRCPAEDFASLEVVITGAERLPPDLADAFEKQFGVRPVEGYGATELSPVVSTNVPPNRIVPGSTRGCKEGTVGQPLPGVAVRVVDLETGEDLGPDQPGMLWVTGPNVMKGYLGQPEATAKVIRDGWYVTGDVGMIDRDGYICITGRESRFSKIGGEMVPHLRIEEELTRLLGLEEEEEGIRLAVLGVPDLRKGERLIVIHTGLPKPPEQVCRELAAQGLPPIWIPSPESFVQVEAIPVLGTGKLDLKRVKELAMERSGK
jgi:acyl-[acyl-carrier-protein]-phospholipid O-acyltransferase/long-chain-fatty-acid--[acyl-carrier-protein] ligase